MATRKAVELIETRDTCAICEDTPRYRVMLHGVQVDELHFNMRGYVGDLPLPNGRKLGMPEGSISSYRREVARINRDFAEFTAHPTNPAKGDSNS